MTRLIYFLVGLSFLLYLFPEIDLFISSLFYMEPKGFFFKDELLFRFLYRSVNVLSVTITILVVLAYVYQHFRNKEFKYFNKKALIYIFLVFSLGSGVVVNAVLKDNFGRARPKNIELFGGNKEFSKVMVYNSKYSGKCKSFSCGHCSFALGFIAFYFLFRKRWILIASLSYGLLVSLGRVVQGGHFFSDFVFSFLVMLLTAKIVYYFMYEKSRNKVVLG